MGGILFFIFASCEPLILKNISMRCELAVIQCQLFFPFAIYGFFLWYVITPPSSRGIQKYIIDLVFTSSAVQVLDAQVTDKLATSDHHIVSLGLVCLNNDKLLNLIE